MAHSASLRLRLPMKVLRLLMTLVVAALSGEGIPATAQTGTLAQLPGWAQTRHPPVRRALVIGIGDYVTAPDLKTPPHDADLMRTALNNSGFLLEPRLPARPNRDQILNAIEALRDKIQTGDIVVVYFSGHGVQSADRANFLLPADADVAPPGEEFFSYVPVSKIVELLNEKQTPGVVTLILDACRANPFPGAVAGQIDPDRYEPYADRAEISAASIGANRGLIVVESGKPNTQIAFAASTDQRSYSLLSNEEPSLGSLYTRDLIRNVPFDEMLGKVFKSTSSSIYGATGHRQLPEVRDVGAYDISMVWPVPSLAIQQQVEVWSRWVSRLRGNADDIKTLQDYIDRNGASDFARAARDRITALSRGKPFIGGMPVGDYAFTGFGADKVWSGSLKSFAVGASERPDFALVADKVDVIEPQSFWLVPLPDRRLISLEPGQSVRILSYDANGQLAKVDLGDGTSGFIRGVREIAARPTVSADLAFAGQGLSAAVADWSNLDAILPQSRAASSLVRVHVGAASADSLSLSRQISYLRGLDVEAALIARGVDRERILIEPDSDAGADRARVDIIAGVAR